MKSEDHAARFSEIAEEYDERQDSEEYGASANLVIEHAAPQPDDVVLDLGCGTGAISLALAPDAGEVVGRDISDGMLDQARQKAADADDENVRFGHGSFREPNVDDLVAEDGVDVVTSNFALHHLSDAEKREAIEVVGGMEPRRFVLGDVMLFTGPDPDEPFYSPEVDDPSTVGHLVDCVTDEGFVVTAVERVHDQVGVIVGERPAAVAARETSPGDDQ